jgi:hypothetical protein
VSGAAADGIGRRPDSRPEAAPAVGGAGGFNAVQKILTTTTAAIAFSREAGDGNRTRTVSLGMETMPAWAHGGQGQSCPYLTVSARQGSFVDR